MECVSCRRGGSMPLQFHPQHCKDFLFMWGWSWDCFKPTQMWNSKKCFGLKQLTSLHVSRSISMTTEQGPYSNEDHEMGLKTPEKAYMEFFVKLLISNYRKTLLESITFLYLFLIFLFVTKSPKNFSTVKGESSFILLLMIMQSPQQTERRHELWLICN